MAFLKTNKKNVLTGIIGIIILGITIVTVYLTQKWVPVMMDDLWYSTKLSDDTPIRNARDIFEAQVWHYNNWGGRSMAHTLLQFILLTGAKCADVLKSISEISKMRTTLQELEQTHKTNLAAQSKVRGDVELGAFDD